MMCLWWLASCFKYSMLQSCQFTTPYGPKETNNAQCSNLHKADSVLFQNCLHGEAFWSLK